MQTQNCYPIFKLPSNYDPSLNPVGMDVGTTRCCVGVNRKDGIEVIAIDNSQRCMPSYVSYDEEQPKCGQIVCNRIKHHFKSTVFDIKRIIGKSSGAIVVDPNWPFKVVETNGTVEIVSKNGHGADILLSPEAITSSLIKHLKKEVENYQSQQFVEAVISVPAAFNQMQIDATIEAGKLAGLNTIHILPEPIAACLTYASKQQLPNNSTVLLFDLGGGTLDVCVIHIADENLHILGSFGDLYLGGRDFDAVLMNHFTAVLKEKYNLDLVNDMNDGKLLKRCKLLQLCQGIKHDLQNENVKSAWLDVDDVDGMLDGQITIQKAEFEKLSEGLLLRIRFKIFNALNNINCDPESIDYVLLAGGGCRMLMVKEALKNIFPNSQHLCTVDPDWAVAYGATLYCHYLKTAQPEDLKSFNSKNQQERPQSNSKPEPPLQKTEIPQVQNPRLNMRDRIRFHQLRGDMNDDFNEIFSSARRTVIETSNQCLKNAQEAMKNQNSTQQQRTTQQSDQRLPPFSLFNQLYQKDTGK